MGLSRSAGRIFGVTGGGDGLNRNQQAAARQLSLAAYLLSCGGAHREEPDIRNNLPAYREVHDASLGEDEDREKAADALRKQLARDVRLWGASGSLSRPRRIRTGGATGCRRRDSRRWR